MRGHGRTAFLLVANCDPYTYAGALPLRVAPLARFEGGLDVVGPRRVTPLLLPRFALYLARGRGQERDPDVLYLHDADRIEAVCDTPTPLQVDGEDLGDVTEVVFEAERDAAVVLTGPVRELDRGARQASRASMRRPRSRQYAPHIGFPASLPRGTCRVSSIATSSRTGP